MKSKISSMFITTILILFAAGCTPTAKQELTSSTAKQNLTSSTAKRDLASFKQGVKCYDRQTQPYTSVVDSHLHFRPFGGEAIPFLELTEYLKHTGVRFVNIYGIGQMLPVDSTCTYYLDCLSNPVTPTIKNDFVNAANYVEFRPRQIHMTLSMTFPDLAKPEKIVEQIKLYDEEYPKMFKWMGEVNLVKQALFGNNGSKVANKENIDGWADFMELLEERKIPLNIHSDLGCDAKPDPDPKLDKKLNQDCDDEPTKYLYLMEYVLKQYPRNKIVWGHMGLSLELSKMNVPKHIDIMTELLNENPNLMFDISWRVLYDNYFNIPEYRDLYVAFFNEYPERILTGTDFVASSGKTFETYREELDITSRINKHLNDNAFRNIALGGNYSRLLDLGYRAPQICAQ